MRIHNIKYDYDQTHANLRPNEEPAAGNLCIWQGKNAAKVCGSPNLRSEPTWEDLVTEHAPHKIGRTVDVTSIMDRARVGEFHLRVLLLCVLVAMLDGFDTQAIAFVAPVMAVQWGMPMAQFSAVFSAGLLGLTIGALTFGPLADKFGRKRVLLACTFLFGVFALWTAFAADFSTLLMLRLLTGVGLGGAMPNIIAMTSEYAPRRLRATAVTVMFCGFPLGSTLGGFLAAKLIPAFGWMSVFVLGGALPILLTPILAYALPESVRFLIAHGAPAKQIGSILDRIGGSPGQHPDSDHYVLPEQRVVGFTGRHLFTEGRSPMTLLLWAAFFNNLLVMYFLVSWLPSLLKQLDYALEAAIYATSILNLGGVIGGVVLGRLIDRMGPFVILGGCYALASLFIAVVAAGNGAVILFSALFIVGFGIVGAQIGMNAVASSLYPTTLRATGVGWALGVGRLGSIIGPAAGGILLAVGWSPNAIFLASAAPALFASIMVFALGALIAHRARANSPVGAIPAVQQSE